MVPLIGDHLVDDRGLAVGDGRHRFEILSRGGDRVGDRGRIALIGTLDGDTHNGARLHVNRVLGLMREMRAPGSRPGPRVRAGPSHGTKPFRA